MGDRANIIFNTVPRENATTASKYLPGSIVLYSHHGGSEIAGWLADALDGAERRWDDEGYATRIIVSRIVGEDWREEGGFGLYVGEISDNERPMIVVDFRSQQVRIFGDAEKTYSFSAFADMSADEAYKAHIGGGE